MPEEDGARLGLRGDGVEDRRIVQEPGDIIENGDVGRERVVHGRVVALRGQANGFIQAVLSQFQTPEDVIATEDGAGLFG